MQPFTLICSLLFCWVEWTTKKIISECIKGKPRAQRELFDALSPKMMTVCLRYMDSHDEAEDVFQMAFVKVFNNLNEYSHNGSFEGWVRRIFANSCLDTNKKRTKKQSSMYQLMMYRSSLKMTVTFSKTWLQMN